MGTQKIRLFFSSFFNKFQSATENKSLRERLCAYERARSSSIDRDGGDDDDDVDVDDGIDIDVIRRPMRCVDGGLDHYTKT